jgi:hypothetical protein
MELKNLLKKTPSAPPPEYFLAVEISDSLIKTAVWQVKEEIPSVINYGSIEAWENEDSLINGLDISLTHAVKNLEIEPTKVIFGLPESWLVGDKLDSSRGNLIKRITKDLSLRPIGLVTTTEAILQQLKVDEGIPPSIILLEIFPTKVTVSLTRLGQIENREEVGRSDDLAKDVEEGLVRIGSDKLPARFILTNGTDLENEVQQILSYPWQEKLHFLHLPKVESLSADYSIKAVALSGGAEAAKSLGLEIDTPSSNSHNQEDDTNPTSLDELGFSIESNLDQSDSRPLSLPIGEITTTPESLINQDSPIPSDTLSNETVEIKKPINLQLPKITAPKLPRFKFHFPKFPSKFKPKLLFPIAIILFIPLLLFLFYTLTAKAAITIKIKPQNFSQSISVTLASSPQDDKVTVPAVFQNTDISVNEEIPTTGETTVGDKATGQVTIYNRSNEPKTLKSGSLIEATTGQIFSLDNTITVASSSAETEPPFTITPGSEKVNVTAAKIGVESNLPKNSQFGVSNFPKSVLIASSENDFINGSSRTVKAVDKNDTEKLLALANEKIKNEVEAKIKTQDPDQRSFLLKDPTITKKSFNHNVGAEASTISLDLSAEVTILTYSHSRLTDVLSEAIVTKNQPGMRLVPEKTTIDLKNPQKTADNVYTADAQFSGLIIPSNINDYQGKLPGLPIAEAKRLLENIRGYSGMTLKITPNLPFFNQYLPRQKNNISLESSIE